MSQSTARIAPRLHSELAENAFAINRRIFASQLDARAKVILLVVLDHARYGKSKCTASNATIALEAHVGVRQAIGFILDLVKVGWLSLERLGPTKHHGRVLRMGGVCTAPQRGVRTGADPCLHTGADPVCERVQTKIPKREREKETGPPARPPEGRPDVPAEDMPYPAMRQFFAHSIPAELEACPTRT